MSPTTKSNVTCPSSKDALSKVKSSNSNFSMIEEPFYKGTLYRPEYEHDACGMGFVADISGRPAHSILEKAIESVVNMAHRGALSADAKTGDGAGILTQVPSRFFRRELAKIDKTLPAQPRDLGVGMIFLPGSDGASAQKCMSAIEERIACHGITLFGWRRVPVNQDALGAHARASLPDIRQVMVGRPGNMPQDAYPRTLYLIRKELEAWALEEGIKDFHLPSFSNATLVYKGLVVATQLHNFYLDLTDPDYETALAIFHQRYSTNTFPTWTLAQPFRFLAHNGEINTLQGNRNWMRAREPELCNREWGDQVKKLSPVIVAGGSDSASLDNALEALVLSGRSLLHSMAMLVPEAWENMPNMQPSLRDFYEYHACLSEPWDGPAALAFSDGDTVAACLDRNGLRPARYAITEDGLVIVASEAGVIKIDESKITEKGRLGPGQMIAVDTRNRKLWKNQEIKESLASMKPYGQWLRNRMVNFNQYLQAKDGRVLADAPDMATMRAFGYTSEEVKLVILPMVAEAKEPVGSMGDDTPLAVLSDKPRLLYSHFKQKFAQVTNPAIDPLREQLVMSLNTYLGPRHSLLEESEEHAHLVSLRSPILLNHELSALKSMPDTAFASVTISALFEPGKGPSELRKALLRICNEASLAVDLGKSIVVLSDRGVDRDHAPIPMLLAVGAVHHYLIRQGKRMRASIIAETGEARDMHHMVSLLGYGASAINPYLAFATLIEIVSEERAEEMPLEKAVHNYKDTLEKQTLKIMSKMGISALSSYQGAQVFEIIGINDEVVSLAFNGTPSSIQGIGLEEIAHDVLERHRRAYCDSQPDGKLDDHGYYRFRKDGEHHAFNPPMIRLLHKSVSENGTKESYDQFRDMVAKLPPVAIRDLLTFKPLGPAVPLAEVEPASEIVKRFTTGSMSLGALSPEAHEVLALAMNRIGGKSGTGEGGESNTRFHSPSNSRIKQVASGRFGVTPEYIAMADELEIKIAQGSKPGEGGQLPGHKVVDHIAAIRHTQPGVPLISPPPHHDIYSIEDLAQLIYDLKVANPRAKVSVKLVAEAGVGTIAAGVAKAYADIIHISGHEGGTGASPLISIKNAGSAWELGLAETQQILVMNDLRDRVMLRTDGGMRTARDVLVAAMLGAEEYGFGTGALVAIGCQMARQCHLNTCPVGIASQNPLLRKKFSGTPEMLIRYLFYIAEELRGLMAGLGARSLNEVIGRPELLASRTDMDSPRVKSLDLSHLLAQPDAGGMRPKRHTSDRNDRGEPPLDDELLPLVRPAIDSGYDVTLERQIRNGQRTVGARIAGEIAYRYGDQGLTKGSINLNFTGSAGQSFGAFCINGMRLHLEGEANDYVGKGMSGGEIAIRPHRAARFSADKNVIVGNTVLYGATDGYFFASGQAGERLAIRNSGAWVVVEGAGDHCCEYMTSGVVVVLGPTGRNFAAGMSGGMAFVLDPENKLRSNYNPGMVDIGSVDSTDDVETLKALVERHRQVTGSLKAKEVLENWESFLPHFRKVAPKPTVAPPPPREVQRARRNAILAASLSHKTQSSPR